MRLERYLKSYIKNNKKSLNNYLAKYSKLKDMNDVITCAVMAKFPNGNKHPHQRRVKLQVMEQVRDKLLEEENKIKECKSFDELIEIIESCKVKGFGELAIYDTALRIGSKINIYPEKIYLHAGTKIGAKELGLKIDNKVIEVSKLPEELKKLKPYEIEDFLCIYKDKFKRRLKKKEIKKKLIRCCDNNIIRYQYIKK